MGLTGMDVTGFITEILPGTWVLWVLSAVMAAAGCCWGFLGKRGYGVISLVQGFVFGALTGIWCGTAIEDAIAAGGMTAAVFADALAQIRVGVGAAVGLVAGGLLFALLGRFWSRFFFLMGGGLFGMLLTIGFIRVFRLNMENPLLLVLAMLVATAVLSLWLSYRFPLQYTGIWGGFSFASGLMYPAICLFAFIGGPSWLPVLAAGGMGVIMAIAGISIQMDRQLVEGQKPHYNQDS